jgi:hypothetical protein
VRGGKSYEGEIAWSSINHLILSLSVDPLNHRKVFKGERAHGPFVRIGSNPTSASSANIVQTPNAKENRRRENDRSYLYPGYVDSLSMLRTVPNS